MTDPTADRPAPPPTAAEPPRSQPEPTPNPVGSQPLPDIPELRPPAPFPTPPAYPSPPAFPAQATAPPATGPAGFAALDPARDPYAPSTAPETAPPDWMSAPAPSAPPTASPAAPPAAPHSAPPTGMAGYAYPALYGGGYAGYGVPPAGPYVVFPQPKTNGLAVASMVVSITGSVLLVCYGVGGLLGAVGAVLGHVARRQIRERQEAGGGMALAGVIVGWIAFGLALLIVGFFVVIFVLAVNTDPDYSSSVNGLDAIATVFG